MSCIVLDIELVDKNDITDLGVLIDRKIQGYTFRPPKKQEPTKQAFWCTRNLHGLLWNSGRLDYSEISNILPRTVNGEYFAEGTEKSKILGNLLDEEVEILEDHGCPKVQDFVHEEVWICSSYPFTQKTTHHFAERMAKLFGSWIMRYLT